MLSDEQIAELEVQRRIAKLAGPESRVEIPCVVFLELLSAHDDAVRLRVESDMLHYIFHNMGESWMPSRDTYGQWKNDLYRIMVDRRYWTNGAPEYAALRPAGQGGGEDGDWNEGVRLSGKAD